MSSILTNTSSMVALQTMRSINKQLGAVQSNIATGKTVATAKDNAAFWAIGQFMSSDVQGFKAVNESLAFADSAINVARAGAETITKLLVEVKEKLVAANDGTADGDTIQRDIAEFVSQIGEIVNASQFNGLNLLTTAADTEFLGSLNRADSVSVDVATITVTNLAEYVGDPAGTPGAGGAVMEFLLDIDVATTPTGAIDANTALSAGGTDLTAGAVAVESIDGAIAAMSLVATTLGTAGKRVEIQMEFNKNISDTLKQGIGAITDTDMEEASARLQALQVQQQLGVQALSIANQQPQTLLSLFR